MTQHTLRNYLIFLIKKEENLVKLDTMMYETSGTIKEIFLKKICFDQADD